MVNIILIAVIAIIVGGAAGYIYQSKKRGVKCIGCPDAPTCGCNCAGCCGCGQQKV